MRVAVRNIALVFTVSALASCAGRDSTPGSSPPPEGKAAETAAAKPPPTPPPSVADGPADTMPPSLLPVRTKHDTAAFVSTVAFGRRQAAKWPTPPAALPGSILPGKRIVAFYGN